MSEIVITDEIETILETILESTDEKRTIVLVPTKSEVYKIFSVLGGVRDYNDPTLPPENVNWGKEKYVTTTYDRGASILLSNPEIAKNSRIVMLNLQEVIKDERVTSVEMLLALNKRYKKLDTEYLIQTTPLSNLNELARYLKARIKNYWNRRSIKIKFKALDKGEDTTKAVISTLREKCVVLVYSRKDSENVAKEIEKNTNYTAKAFHAGIDARDRKKTIKDFIEGGVNIIVATTAILYTRVRTPFLIIVNPSYFKEIDVYRAILKTTGDVTFVYEPGEHRTISRVLNGNYQPALELKYYLGTLILRGIKCGWVKSYGDLKRLPNLLFNPAPVTTFEKAFRRLVKEELITTNVKLTPLGDLLAKHYLPVYYYYKLKPFVPKNQDRTRKLEYVCKAIKRVKRTPFPMRKDKILDAFESTEAKEVASQLIYKTGDTIPIAIEIRRISKFLHELLNDYDFLALAEAMNHLIKSAKHNTGRLNVIEHYLKGTLDQLIVVTQTV